MPKQEIVTFDFVDMNGNPVTVTCWTTHVYDGFIHHAQLDDTKARVKWYNRTWESFQYQSVLRALFNKVYAAPERDYMLDQINDIEKKTSERCEREFAQIKSMYDGLSDTAKHKLADTLNKNDIDITSTEQAESIVKLTAAFDAMELLK